MSAAGTYALTSPEMFPRTYQSLVEFIPAIGPRQARTVPVTIDTQAPRVLAAAPYGVGHSSLDHFDVTFTEPIDTSTLAAATSVLSPIGTPIQPVEIVAQGSNVYRVQFPVQVRDGIYQLNDRSGVGRHRG